MDKARDLALQVLREVREEGAYANVALVRALRRQALSDVDRRFVTELVYGAVKAGDTLDWMLRRYTDRPLTKIPLPIREILRLGIFQLFFLDRVPKSAAVNESVELAKRYGHAGTVRFVNAVLRTAVREPERAAFPTGKGHATEHLALSFQHPVWLVRRFLKAFGYEETERLLAFDNAPAVLSLRTNTLRTDRDGLLAKLAAAGVEAEPSAWAPEGILCRQHGAMDEMAALKEGLFQVQDESSMQVAHVLGACPGEFVIDACSAPGGKTTHLAALMENRGRIKAFDIYEGKLKRVEENASRLGIRIIETECRDAREIGRYYQEQADRVLVDAPCSGLGVLHRRPDARWRKTESDIAALPGLQLAILEGAAPAVKPGGVLVYSTCTVEPAENAGVVEQFLAAHDGFFLEKAGPFLPTRPTDEEMVQFYPQRHGIDGFFIARLRRKE